MPVECLQNILLLQFVHSSSLLIFDPPIEVVHYSCCGMTMTDVEDSVTGVCF